MVVPAIHPWPTNAALIADANKIHPLGVFVLDATYGRGRWWAEFRPRALVTNDANSETDAEFHDDYKQLRWDDDTFDGAAFDPPYKFNGTPALGDFDDAYGLEYMPWQERMVDMAVGLAEVLRVVKPGGFVYAKCQDQVVSGRVRWQTIWMAERAEQSGARLVDRFDMVGGTRPQPTGRRQLHARGRGSTLLVFEAR